MASTGPVAPTGPLQAAHQRDYGEQHQHRACPPLPVMGRLADGLTGGQATALAWLVNSVPADPAENVTGWGLRRDLLTRLDALFGHARQVRLLG